MTEGLLEVSVFADVVASMAQPAVGPLMVAIAGPPGSGKSTLADWLSDLLRSRDRNPVIVSMDGFHLADQALVALGRADFKGAHDTFDVEGFASVLLRIRNRGEVPIWVPRFDRSIEAAIAGSVAVGADHDIVIVEGNYLLLRQGQWAQLDDLFDLCAYLEHTDHDARRESLIRRHQHHGRTRTEAEEWVDRNDEPNARLVATTAHRGDVVVKMTF